MSAVPDAPDDATRTLHVDGLRNARDLGGLPLLRGGATPFGVFVRSESLDLVPEAGWARLQDHGVRSIVDLRRPDEREAGPAAPPDGVELVLVELLDPEFERTHYDDGLAGTPLHHAELLAEAPSRTLRALAEVATARPGTVLVHCVGGRDRTGLISALLLAAGGVDPDAIVQDYLESIRNAPAYWALRQRPSVEPRVAALLAARGTTSAEAMRDFLERLDVGALLAHLPADQAEAIRTWRGALV